MKSEQSTPENKYPFNVLKNRRNGLFSGLPMGIRDYIHLPESEFCCKEHNGKKTCALWLTPCVYHLFAASKKTLILLNTVYR